MPDVPEREQVVARIRPHGRALFWPTLLLLAVAAAYGYFGAKFPEAWLSISIAAAAVLVLIVGWLLPVLRWLARNYTITTRRIVLRSGILVRTRQEVLHSRISAITVRQGWLQSLYGSGDILLDAGGSASPLLRDVPSVVLTQDVLHDLMESNQRE